MLKSQNLYPRSAWFSDPCPFLWGSGDQELASFLQNLLEDSRFLFLFPEVQIPCVWSEAGWAFKKFSSLANCTDPEVTEESLPSAHHWCHQEMKLQAPPSHVRLRESESAFLTNCYVIHLHSQASKCDYQLHIHGILIWQPASVMVVKK